MNTFAVRIGTKSSRLRGVSVVEVLVALALAGIVMAGLLSLTSSTLGFTGLSSSISTSVKDLSQAEGYLADMFRTAKRIETDTRLREGGSVLVDCGAMEDGRCISVLTPVVSSGAAQRIEDFDLSVFAVEPIGNRFAAEGIPRGWNGPETLALFEYRVRNVCEIAGDQPCAVPPSTLSESQRTVTGEVGFIVGGLSATDADGDVVPTFDLNDDLDDFGRPRTLVLSLVARADSQLGQPFTLRRSPFELQQVAVRGAAD